jgi:hypothetical protein
MSYGEARISRLEDRLRVRHVLPTHLPLALWPEWAVVRLLSDRAVADALTDFDIERLIAECEARIAEG